MSAILGGIGLGLGIGGTAMLGNKASQRQAAMKKLARWALEGQDLNAVTGESLGGYQKNFPLASEVGSAFNTYYQQELDRLAEQAYPGYAGQRQQYSDLAESYLRGEIPSDVQSAVMRGTAGRSLFGGYSGSGLHRNLAARDLGLTSLDITGRGSQMLGNAMNMFPRANPVDVVSLSGFSPQQTAQIRANERAQYMGLMANAIGLPGASDIWGGWMQQTGGALTGMGAMGMLGGGSIGGGGQANMGGVTSYNPYNTYQPYGFAPGTSASYIQGMYR